MCVIVIQRPTSVLTLSDLYNDSVNIIVIQRPTSALTLSELDDYTASVDLNDIEKIADNISLSGTSLPSVLDWDVIDDLISSVQ